MSLKKILFFFIAILAFSASAQKNNSKSFVLEWDMSSKIEISNGTSLQIPTIKDNYVDSNGLPEFSSTWSLKSNKAIISSKIKNVSYTSFSSKELKNIDIEKIPNELNDVFTISKGGNKFYATLSMNPLIKEGNSIKRIVSFDFEYKLGNIRSNKGTSVLAEDSVLANGTWYKFSVDKTGVFKLDANFLQSLGINTSGLDPKNIKIYGNGGNQLPQLNSDFRFANLQENALYIEGANDNSFDASDFILFYAKGPHSWDISDEENISHQYNIYSELAYYFISVDSGEGKRIETQTPVTSATTDEITTYTDYIFFEEDENNIYKVGKQWFGDFFGGSTTTRNYSFSFNDIDLSKEVTIKGRAVAQSSSISTFEFLANNSSLFNLNFPAISNASFVKSSAQIGNAKISPSSETINLQLTYNNNGNPSGSAYLDYIEIIGDKKLIANGKQFSFRNFTSKQSGKILEYTIENKSNIDFVWDISDFLNPKLVENQVVSGNGYNFKTTSGTLNEYIVLNESDYYLPKTIGNSPIENQNLHGLKDIQYLVITQKEFVDQAQRLADYHQNNSGLTSKVVDIDEIYNEFASGSKDITGIRDFVKFLYDNASSTDKRIKYICLFGDASYDFKDRVLGNNNIVPSYQSFDSFGLVTSFVTDDYYGMMDANEGLMTRFEKQDVATGRILFSNVQQAESIVDKTLRYYDKSSLGAWNNEVTLMSDDLGNASESVLQSAMENIADLIKVNKPQYNLKKLYADAFRQVKSSGGDTYPDVNLALRNAIEKGTLLIDYFGHGGEDGLGDERYLQVSDIKSWQNINNLPLFITVTCDFSRFDNPEKLTAGEEMVLNSNGGAATLISTTREVFISYGQTFNLSLIPKLLDFNNENKTISEALMETKNERPSFSNQHFFIFTLGDPAMKLKRPQPNIRVTKINDKDVAVSRDTLKALSRIKIEGEVTDISGNLLTDFNGTLSTSIFDKPVDKKTLDNDGFGVVMTFDVQDSKVFQGGAEVKDGKFSIEMIIPKDIKATYGNSKISLYSENGIDAKGGVDLNTIIGGIDPNAIEDITGPEVSLFMNDESFVDGGNTNSTPNLKVKLFDVSGINTSLGSIGHNITAVLDGDVANPIVLNEFYETELGDFTNGNISYALPKLEEGLHTIKLKVWDTYNNSSEKTLSFKVTKDSDFLLENVLNYPNPFINYTEFWFNHNKPNEALSVKISIFTVSGKLVKSINTDLPASGNVLSRSITWDGLDDFGQKVGKGVYVYNLEVTSKDTNVRANKYQKLVILQ